MKIKSLQNLQKGDAISLVSTARKVSKEELNFAVNLLESWGLKISYGENIFQEEHQFAGSVEQRTQDLQEAINDENVLII